jgi:hypothetical protein
VCTLHTSFPLGWSQDCQLCLAFCRCVSEACNKTHGLQIELALQWSNTSSETLVSFVNCIRTVDGGTHVDGMKQALTRVINKLAKEKGLQKEGTGTLSGEHVREGLTAVCTSKCPFFGSSKHCCQLHWHALMITAIHVTSVIVYGKLKLK